MRYSLLILAALVFACSGGDELSPSDTFIKFYGADGGYTMADMALRSDGEEGVVLFGTREVLDGDRLGETDLYLIVTDASGKVVDSSDDLLFTDGLNELASRITRISDGYLLIGTVTNFPDGVSGTVNQIAYIRLNNDLTKNGDWVYVGDLVNDYVGTDILLMEDNGILVAGHTNINGTNDFYYQKIGGDDLVANPEWTRIQTRANSDDQVTALLDNLDGTYTMIGRTDAASGDGEGGVNVERTIISSDGIIQNSLTYGINAGGVSDANDFPMDVIRRPSGFAIVGTSYASLTDFQPFVMLVDYTGAKIFEEYIDNDQITNGLGRGIVQLENNDYFLVGANSDVADNGDQSLIVKLDQEGVVKNSIIRNYGLLNGNEMAIRALPAGNNSIYVGATYEFGSGGLKQFALLKVNSDGELKK